MSSIGAAIGIAGALGAGATVASSVIGSHAASKAADAQVSAADRASTLQTELGQEGVNLQTEQMNAASALDYPYLLSGYGAEANLSSLLGLPVSGTYDTSPPQFSAPGIPGVAPGTGGGTATGGGGLVPGGTAPLSNLVNPSLGAKGSLLAPFGETFTAPTAATEQNDPGYQFRLDQGMKALQNSAAARGNLLTGQTQADIADYSQNYASNEYNNVYNRQFGQFQQAYNIYKQKQTDTFNKLSAMANGGQVAAQQLNSATGQGVGNVNNILLGTGAQVGANMQNAGAARASGYVGSANAINGGLSSLSNLAYLPMASRMLEGSGGGGGNWWDNVNFPTTGDSTMGVYS